MATLGGAGRAGGVVVQKYGGSSLATGEQLGSVARRVRAVARTGARVVVVVSARGKATDELIRLAEATNPRPRARELDQLLATGETSSAALLAMALQHTGAEATALAGAQTGILATGPHGAGIIVAIDTERTMRLLDAGQIVVVAGFQGMTADGDVITLGRGGSDTTAVAVAAELGARHCEIYSDVAGVLTADPRVVPGARLLSRLDADVMTEMAFAGARVMHARAVELAALHEVDIHVGHAAAAVAGTRIHASEEGTQTMLEAKPAVLAVVHDPDVARVTLRTAKSGQDRALSVFRALAGQSVPADMATVSDTPDGGQTIGLTIHRSHTAAVRAAFARFAAAPADMEIDEQVAKVSIVGKGLLSRPEYAARMLACLTGSGIAAPVLTASQLRVSVTVAAAAMCRAVQLLHTEFGLDADELPEPPVQLAGRP